MQFVIPTIFTARDQMSPVVSRIRQGMEGMNATAQRQSMRFGNLTSSMMGYMGAATAAGAAAAGIYFSGKSIMDYERELANLKALTGATGEEFEQFKSIIQQVAYEQKKSSVATAQAFTVVANAMPELLEDAQGLGIVTNATLTLAKAARMELAPAAEAVTTILNQYGKSAGDAGRLVDLMAAGSKYGSAEIEDLSLSLKEFAAQAKLAGVSMTESVAVTEIVSKFRKGTQAGVELRNVLLYLDTLKGQDPKALKDLMRLGVNMDLVANKSLPLSVRLKELQKISGDASALFHVFGKENSAMAANVLQNAGKLEGMITKLQENGVASKMAAENTGTLYAKLDQLTGRWVQLITGANGSNMALSATGAIIDFVTNNMGTLLNIAMPVIGMWAMYKTTVWGVRAATIGYNIVTGLAAGFTSNLSVALMENTVAARAETIAIKIRTAAVWLATEASLALQIVTGVGLVAAIGGMAYLMSSSTNTIDKYKNSLAGVKDEVVQVKQEMSKADIALMSYNAAMEEYNTKAQQRAIRAYEREQHPFKAMLDDMFRIDQLWGGDKKDKEELKVPQFADFPGLDTVEVQARMERQKQEGYKNDSVNNNLKVIIENRTNNAVSIGNAGGAVPVQVQQTGSYNRGR